MKISVRRGDLLKEKTDLLVLNRFSDKDVGGAYAAVDAALGGLLETVAKEEGFKAALGSTMTVRTVGALPASRVVVVGLGPAKSFREETVRVAGAASLNAAKAAGAKSVASVLHGVGGGGLDARACGKALCEGVRLADYEFGRYKSEAAKKSPDAFVVLTTDAKKARAAADGAALGERYAGATAYARDLVNTPGQHMRPIDLVEAARALAKGNAAMRVKVYGKTQLERMGAGGILGVNQGSDHEPYLVHVTYKPKAAGPRGREAKRVALVGKAVTFDSGGLSLKPASAMETMKCDMAGAAAVLGAFSVIDEIGPNAEVHGIFAAVENMPSGKAIRPGDVVTIMNGKTIEVRNTDAEGRVTLADALTYAARQKPDVIVDLATLTGACVVALGEEYTGLMSNDDALAKDIEDAARAAGENVWRLPLPEEYKELIKTDIADYKNDAPRWGGSLTAGLLLQEFVDGKPWVHLDIAGPSFAERPMNAYTKKGGTGHGTRTLLEYLRAV
jgi:leucyl aminopeptidase